MLAGRAASIKIVVTSMKPTGRLLRKIPDKQRSELGDSGNGIADTLGNAYITGQTCSLDFLLAGNPFQATNKTTGGCAAFVSKLIS
ncbi:MAG TPA: SBBP repeat-containing protein [Silvibacterium sp.]|nr:SBBP repeat-containing protein [Silvibacterium sp.]